MLRNSFGFFKYHRFACFITSYRTKYVVIVPFYAELAFLQMLWLTSCLAQLEPSEYFADGYYILVCTSAEFEMQDRSSIEPEGNINQFEVWIICGFGFCSYLIESPVILITYLLVVPEQMDFCPMLHKKSAKKGRFLLNGYRRINLYADYF